MTSIVGVDLGGTMMRVTRYDASSMDVQKEERQETHAKEGFEDVMKRCIAIVKSVKQDDTKGVGVGVAGLIQQPEGIVIKTPNIPGGENVKLKKMLEDELQTTVLVQNDAHCFALAEALLGAGKGKKIVIGITMGTGVGGGIVIDGKIFDGGNGFAGELGHMLLMPGKPPYESQDMRGEVEQFLSGTAMGRRCTAAKKPEDYFEGEVCEWMQPDVFREVAWLCTNLTYMLNPNVIVFGGSAGRALQPHLDAVTQEFKKWTLHGTPLPELAVSSMKHTGAIGAALLVRS
jgi:predicted NBD/HSP70 family sugar kinase